jgi:hypothetical protein
MSWGMMMTTDTEDVLRDLTTEQRAFVRGVGEGYSLARKEIQHDFERMFKQLKDETNAEMQAMRTALARLCAIDSAVNTQRDPDQKLQ